MSEVSDVEARLSLVVGIPAGQPNAALAGGSKRSTSIAEIAPFVAYFCNTSSRTSEFAVRWPRERANCWSTSIQLTLL
jgi:hypothetical protein